MKHDIFMIFQIALVCYVFIAIFVFFMLRIQYGYVIVAVTWSIAFMSLMILEERMTKK